MSRAVPSVPCGFLVGKINKLPTKVSKPVLVFVLGVVLVEAGASDLPKTTIADGLIHTRTPCPNSALSRRTA